MPAASSAVSSAALNRRDLVQVPKAGRKAQHPGVEEEHQQEPEADAERQTERRDRAGAEGR